MRLWPSHAFDLADRVPFSFLLFPHVFAVKTILGQVKTMTVTAIPSTLTRRIACVFDAAFASPLYGKVPILASLSSPAAKWLDPAAFAPAALAS